MNHLDGGHPISNVGRCERCHKFLIGEQASSHNCRILLKDVKTIFIDWISDGIENDDGDYVRRAKGLDGVLYGLVICKHNPPHSTKRDFTGNGTKQELDSPLMKNVKRKEGFFL